MTEEERFRKRVDNLIDGAYSGKLVLLPFLDTNYQQIVKTSFKHNEKVKPYFYGGYSDAEYKRAIFYYDVPKDEMFNIAKLKIDYSRLNGSINHRSILGSVLGLGLKREIVGDIILYEDNYYILVDAKMKDFAIDNLNYIGNVPVKLIEVSYNLENQNKYLEKVCFLASLRLDVIIAGFYNLSRSSAQELIKSGLVKVNHKDTLNISMVLKENDLLSIRGKGRLIVNRVNGKTKSGNLVVEFKKPID